MVGYCWIVDQFNSKNEASFPWQQPESTKRVYPYDVESDILKCSINVVKQNFEELLQQLKKQLEDCISYWAHWVWQWAVLLVRLLNTAWSQSEHGTLEERVQIFSLIEGIQIRFVYFQAEVQRSLCRLWCCLLSGKLSLEIHYIWYSYLNYPRSAIYTTWWPIQVVYHPLRAYKTGQKEHLC